VNDTHYIENVNGHINYLVNEDLIRDFFSAIRHPETDDYLQTIWTVERATKKKHTVWVPSGDIDALVNPTAPLRITWVMQLRF
jgi:hypothetical protein